mmetsp:Transcript_18703/g.61805  ORF Transcript_18703/g.61805 Transcript_18703/m.61805 type:complete len:248 (-) Transcript_18703:234-977(-)
MHRQVTSPRASGAPSDLRSSQCSKKTWVPRARSLTRHRSSSGVPANVRCASGSSRRPSRATTTLTPASASPASWSGPPRYWVRWRSKYLTAACTESVPSAEHSSTWSASGASAAATAGASPAGGAAPSTASLPAGASGKSREELVEGSGQSSWTWPSRMQPRRRSLAEHSALPSARTSTAAYARRPAASMPCGDTSTWQSSPSLAAVEHFIPVTETRPRLERSVRRSLSAFGRPTSADMAARSKNRR